LRHRRVVFKFCEIWQIGNCEIMPCLPDKKISLGSPAIVTAQIAPKICQDQPPTMYSEYSRFHTNRFTFGGVIAEHVNTVKMHHTRLQPSFEPNNYHLVCTDICIFLTLITVNFAACMTDIPLMKQLQCEIWKILQFMCCASKMRTVSKMTSKSNPDQKRCQLVTAYIYAKTMQRDKDIFLCFI